MDEPSISDELSISDEPSISDDDLQRPLIYNAYD